ncbi:MULTISPECIES: hypothetical protein [Halorhodospira]|uniref:hypothetical protein n=1 Tax=Halorhodospira TaxID=85108 RepID=UPI001913DFE9|nr:MULTISPECIES: hypothetical protein [Halorhodospira]MBK5936121.1 hypothetical protein [Halorhodospira halophila]MCG5537273.1 hypothetical protein [Halorhodospira sp. 9622]MCG5540163.1 hypothetical protein [Halorhodospira sp. M39old]MCG5545136.1 hypothetical protein [Halorhodospira sp. M38]
MVDRVPRDSVQSPEDQGLGGAGRSRRRFNKAALASAPLLLTLHSQPLRAAANCTISGWVSANVSRHPDGPEPCGGYTPGYWQGPASARQYPEWGEQREELINSSFGFPGLPSYTLIAGGGPGRGGGFEYLTLHDAVRGPGQSRVAEFNGMTERQLLRFGTATLLNARYLMDFPLTEAQVIDIVTTTLLTGSYTTAAGDTLTAPQVHYFLENTMDGQQSWGSYA